MYMQIILIINLIIIINVINGKTSPEEDQGVRYADRCEACKILATELQDRLTETGKSHDVLEFGYSVDDVKPKKRTEYKKSELRLLESLENVCDRILQYNLHKERKDSTRFAKGMSQTFRTLHGLVDKGVKVDLGIPYELWDNPPVEVTNMKNQCESLLENYEYAIENWYFKYQNDAPLIKYLCEDRALKDKNSKCLYETEIHTNDEDDVDNTDKKKKGDHGRDSEEDNDEEDDDDTRNEL